MSAMSRGASEASGRAANRRVSEEREICTQCLEYSAKR